MTDQKMTEDLRNTTPQHGGQMFFQRKSRASLKKPGVLKYPVFKKDGSFKNPNLVIFCTLAQPYAWQKWKGW